MLRRFQRFLLRNAFAILSALFLPVLEKFSTQSQSAEAITANIKVLLEPISKIGAILTDDNPKNGDQFAELVKQYDEKVLDANLEMASALLEQKGGQNRILAAMFLRQIKEANLLDSDEGEDLLEMDFEAIKAAWS